MSDILFNRVRDGSTVLWPGQSVPAVDVSRVLGLGAALWPASDPIVAEAAVKAIEAIRRGDGEDAQSLLLIAAIRSLRADVIAQLAVVVDDLAGLDAIDAAQYRTGQKAFVGNQLDSWTLAPAELSSGIADPMLARDASDGERRWVRDLLPSPAWLASAEFSLSPTGRDDGRGDGADPLLTLAEVCRRVGQQFSLAPVIVHLIGHFDDEDIEMVAVHPQTTLVVIGEVEPLPDFSAALGSLQLVNSNSNQEWRATSAGASWTAISMMRVSSGANEGVAMWATRDLGSGAVRFTSAAQLDLTFGFAFADDARPGVNDPVDVFLQPGTRFARSVLVASGWVQFVRVNCTCSGGGPYRFMGATLEYVRCRLNSLGCDIDLASNSGSEGHPNIGIPYRRVYLSRCALQGAILLGAGIVTMNDCLVDQGPVAAGFNGSVQLREKTRLELRSSEPSNAGGVGVYGTGFGAFDVNPGSQVINQTGHAYGAQSGPGVVLHAASQFIVNAGLVPRMTTGTNKNVQLGENAANTVAFTATLPQLAPDGSLALYAAGTY